MRLRYVHVPGAGGAFWFQFDLETNLPLHAKMWRTAGRSNLPDLDTLFREPPTVDATTIIVNEPIAADKLEFHLPEGMALLDSRVGDQIRKAGSLFEARKYQDAIDAFQQAIDWQPGPHKPVEALRMIGLCYDALGRYDQALQWLERAVRANPTPSRRLASTYYDLGSEYCEVGRQEDALRAFIHSVQLRIRSGTMMTGLVTMQGSRLATCRQDCLTEISPTGLM